MASEIPNKITFAQLPALVQDAILEKDNSAVISSVFEKVIHDQNMWAKVAKKLNIKVSENPEQDVLSYYRKSNEDLLAAFSIAGHNITRVQGILLQRKMIEDYLNFNLDKRLLLEQKELFWLAVDGDYLEVVKSILEVEDERMREDARLLLFQAAQKGNIEMVKLFLKFNTIIDSDQIEIAKHNGYGEIAALLEQARAKQEQRMEPIFTLRFLTGRNAYNPSSEELQKLVDRDHYFVYRNEKEDKYYLVTSQMHIILPKELFFYEKRRRTVDVNQLEKYLKSNHYPFGQRLSAEEVKAKVYS